jgi:hypothetical protein
MTKERLSMPNAPHKNPQYGLRIPASTMDKLKYVAEYNGRSANKEIEQLILQHIDNFELKHGTITFDDGFVPRSKSEELKH